MSVVRGFVGHINYFFPTEKGFWFMLSKYINIYTYIYIYIYILSAILRRQKLIKKITVYNLDGKMRNSSLKCHLIRTLSFQPRYRQFLS